MTWSSLRKKKGTWNVVFLLERISRFQGQCHYGVGHFFFCDNNFIVIAKKIGGSALGKQNGSLCYDVVKQSHSKSVKNRFWIKTDTVWWDTKHNTTHVLYFSRSAEHTHDTVPPVLCFPALSAQTKDPIFFFVENMPNAPRKFGISLVSPRFADHMLVCVDKVCWRWWVYVVICASALDTHFTDRLGNNKSTKNREGRNI